jgi:hypothetical protein
MPWKSRLRHPIDLDDGRVLRTLADARDMIHSLPERDQREDIWQKLAVLLMSAAQADNSSLTAIITHRIQETLRRPPFTVGGLLSTLIRSPPRRAYASAEAKTRRARRLNACHQFYDQYRLRLTRNGFNFETN